MRDGKLSPMGGNGKTVEIDETYIGRLEGVPKQRSGGAHKNIVMTLVERGGAARGFHIDSTTLNEVTKIVRENVKHETIVNTDEGRWYQQLGANRVALGVDDQERAEKTVRGMVGKRLTYRVSSARSVHP